MPKLALYGEFADARKCMANVKEKYTQVARDARSGRIVLTQPNLDGRARYSVPRDEERIAAKFRKRAQDDYRTS